MFSRSTAGRTTLNFHLDGETVTSAQLSDNIWWREDWHPMHQSSMAVSTSFRIPVKMPHRQKYKFYQRKSCQHTSQNSNRHKETIYSFI